MSCLAVFFLEYSYAKDLPTDIHYTVKELFAAHEPEIDQSIEHVLAVSKDTANNIFIFRKYLDSGWSQYNPERVKYQEYYIRHGQKTIALLTIDSDKVGDGYIKKFFINSALQADGSYLISTKSEKDPTDYYQYSPTSYKVTKLTGKTHNKLTHVTDKRIDFADGMAVFVTQRGSPSLKMRFPENHPFYPDKELVLYRAQQAQAEPLIIDDTITLGNRRYIIGQGHVLTEKYSFIWIVSFNTNQATLDLQARDYTFDQTSILELGFIQSSPARSHPEIWLSQIEVDYSPKSMSITQYLDRKDYLFDHFLKPRRQEKENFIEQRDPPISGVCDNQFAIFREKKSGKVPKGFDIDIVNAKGEIANRAIYKAFDRGVILNTDIISVDASSLLVFVGFGRYENVRRAEGWYSWDGYKVFLFEFTCPKDSVNPQNMGRKK